MKNGRPLVIAGIITMIFGLIFGLQGQSVLGPESSFMYDNPDWIAYGVQIVIAGAILIGIGTGISIFKRSTIK